MKMQYTLPPLNPPLNPLALNFNALGVLN